MLSNSSPHNDHCTFSSAYKNNSHSVPRKAVVQSDYAYGSVVPLQIKGGGFFPNLRARQSNLA